MPIACAQMACTTFDCRSNLEKADQFIDEAVHLGAKLILLPELLTTGYTYDRRLHDFAEPIGGASTRWLQLRSRQTGRWIGAGIVEEADDGIFDTFLLAGPAGEFLSYRKQYLAFFEKLYFHRGRSAGIFDTAIGRLGVMICWTWCTVACTGKWPAASICCWSVPPGRISTRATSLCTACAVGSAASRRKDRNGSPRN